MSARSVTHATFSLERTYDASPARVFSAFADPEVKKRWFASPEEWETVEESMDFRVGGREVNRGGPKGGPNDSPAMSFESHYRDIVPDERIIYTYFMHSNEKLISVSLATIELEPEGAGTKLTLTEQGAFLDGYDDPGLRERGTRELLDALGRELERQLATV